MTASPHWLPRPEPQWLGERPGLRQRVPSEAAGWLFDRASLTRRVQEACAGTFRVERVRQCHERPLVSEVQRLDIRLQRYALVREVQLLCDDAPWVFARTVIPLTTLRGRARRLQHLGNKPLGALLFADPAVGRNGTEIARLEPGHYLFEQAVQGMNERPTVIWGRRAVFYMEGEPLLVNELFLPGLFERR